ncbi:uncharacterized protein L201_006915 [Kwoniella dendrophila CBS 6074]|uniref:protein acetyllysine N-acetyltransferase n=1 Tax=Kwoniella dendrophila CBS 6074 TaxID=1295534 RepID=A0AAX4K530_9TREE
MKCFCFLCVFHALQCSIVSDYRLDMSSENSSKSPQRDDVDNHNDSSSDSSSSSSSSTSASSSLRGSTTNKDSNDDNNDEGNDLKRVAKLIKSGKAKNIIFLLGAGISTSAGIPDFRSPKTGLYSNLQKLNLPFPEAVFELGFFQKNPKPFWILAKEIYPGKYYPTPTHYFLNLLNQQKVLKRVFTQNIDTLESLAGLPEDLIVEAHGSFSTAHCLSCKTSVDKEKILKGGVRNGEVVKCDKELPAKGKGKDKQLCGGLVKPDIVFFGENLPDRFFKHLPDFKTCDLLIVIGTSLQVQPFASLIGKVPLNCPRLLINRESVGPFQSSGGYNKRNNLRNMFWEGDADKGINELVKHLELENEFIELIENGNNNLKKHYKDLEKLETPSKQKTRKDNIGKKIQRETEAVKGVVGESDNNEDTSDTDDLENTIRQKLKL